MTDSIPTHGRQLFSTVTPEGRIELALREVPVRAPAEDEVLIRVEAAPINPSDLGVMLVGTDASKLEAIDNGAAATLPEALRKRFAAREGVAIPIGNEGAGRVIAAGPSDAAQTLAGRTVSLAGGGMYADYRLAKARECMVVPDDATAEDAASSFVNPLTALGMIGTLREEGRKQGYQGIVHTAAASNLGQMLVKLCAAEGIGLVNVVRSVEQAALLKALGAEHVVDSTAPDFIAALTEAISATGAFLAFDAIGGGRLANQILNAMEAAALRIAPAAGPYGSTQMKQVYIYGGLDLSPTEITRGVGMKWGVGGWLLTYFLQDAGQEEVARLRAKVAAELKTTFASSYSRRIALEDAVRPETIAAYNRRATGDKYLIVPGG